MALHRAPRRRWVRRGRGPLYELFIAAAALLTWAASALAAPAIPREQLVREPLRLAAVLDDGRAVELEAFMVRPAAVGRFPLALLTHGSPRNAAARQRTAAAQMSFQAEELARRGYVAVAVLRRGYGTSTGGWDEGYGRCDTPDYDAAARESARDLRAALRALSARPEIDAQRVIVIGQSAGGIAVVALAADAPAGLKAVVNFAGGRGSRGPNDVCREDRLIDAYAALGKRARVPSLWIYTENDLYFRPELAQRMFDAFRAAGGAGELRFLPAFGEDGHTLFYRRLGVAHWRPLLDAFLQQHGLPSWDAPPPEPLIANLPPPRELSANNRVQWLRYLEARDNKAFALASSGRFAWRSGRSEPQSARADALNACGEVSCRIVAENDSLASP